MEWTSTLEQTASVALSAPAPAGDGAPAAWAETWRVVAGPLWHLAYTGLPPVQPGDRRRRSRPALPARGREKRSPSRSRARPAPPARR